MPESANILRIDYVDDGFYKGDFVWAIVNVGVPSIERKVTPPSAKHNTELAETRLIELRVKEKQTIRSNGIPIRAGEADGKIYVECLDGEFSQEHQIAVYKTGQPIDLDVGRLVYLGINRLWIVQELGLYTFLVTP